MENDFTEQPISINAGSLVNILGVVYVHQKTNDGGDIYLTRYGFPHLKHLQIENWYEKTWFKKHSTRLEGTSSVYRIPTKAIEGKSIDLVVKNCRVGEDVPVQTKTILDVINTEFNSPWEEFSLVMELREGKYGPAEISIKTQQPLAIYVPPERMQNWQSGRSIDKINRIIARHPGIDIDILKQYKLVYGWIYGKDIHELLTSSTNDYPSRWKYLIEATELVNKDLRLKGFLIADMKAAHIIIDDNKINELTGDSDVNIFVFHHSNLQWIADQIRNRCYSIVDYELLCRTPEYEEKVSASSRINYHQAQIHRFTASNIPPHLDSVEIFGLNYIHGHVESTGGQLWVVGKNAMLFDYFLPERWRKTHSWKLSSHNDIYYTISKDHIHMVWKISRVGERPEPDTDNICNDEIISYGFNSPFEEFSIAYQLLLLSIPTVYIRAIYMTGSTKSELSEDMSRFLSHSHLKDRFGKPILCKKHNYITIRGFYNGTDDWVAHQNCSLCRPIDLELAINRGYIDNSLLIKLLNKTRKRLETAGFDGRFLKYNDLLLVIGPDGKLITENDGYPEIRICNFELIKKYHVDL